MRTVLGSVIFNRLLIVFSTQIMACRIKKLSVTNVVVSAR